MQQDQHTDISNPTTKTPLSPLPTKKPSEIGKALNRFNKPKVDSLLSTSSDSSNTSSRNPSLSYHHEIKDHSNVIIEDTKFPVLVQKKGSKSAMLSSKLSRTSSFDLEIDSPVREEGEELEREENQFLKKLPVIADAEEFAVKKTHANRFRGREIMFNKDTSRCRSLEASFLPLDSVEEVKNEEELNAFRCRRKLQTIGMADLNEFNQGEKALYERNNKRHVSMNATQPSIIEEQENRILPHLQPVFTTHSASGSRRASILSSPGSKIKVDEIDFMDKKLEENEDDSESTPIDPIMEETEEKTGTGQVVEENKEFQVAKAKMNEEKEFLRKISRSEMLDENDNLFSAEREYAFLGSTVAEDVIEEDTNGEIAANDN